MANILSRNPEAFPCPAGYSLDMYCQYNNDEHEYDEFPHNFFSKYPSKAKQQMRKAGWVWHRDGYGTCPKCAKILGLR